MACSCVLQVAQFAKRKLVSSQQLRALLARFSWWRPTQAFKPLPDGVEDVCRLAGSRRHRLQ